jgi:hypothetical protein
MSHNMQIHEIYDGQDSDHTLQSDQTHPTCCDGLQSDVETAGVGQTPPNMQGGNSP